MNDSGLRASFDQLWDQAQTFQGLGKLREAVVVYGNMIGLMPHVPFLYVQRGLVLMELSDSQKALADFEQALRLDPNLGMAYYGRGWVRHWSGDYAGELADGRRGLSLDVEQAGMYWRRIASAQQGLGRHAEALESFSRALEHNSQQDEGTLLNRGYCYFELGRHAEALADFDRCLKLDPDWSWAFVARARVLIALERFDAAVADLDRAVGYDPVFANAWYFRGIAHRGEGDGVRARQDFEHLLTMSISDALRQKAVVHLQELSTAR